MVVTLVAGTGRGCLRGLGCEVYDCEASSRAERARHRENCFQPAPGTTSC